MELSENKLYSLEDVTILPLTVSTIKHRSECNPRTLGIVGDQDNYLPIITAPMSCLVDEKNYEVFMNNGISPIIPRNVNLETRLELCEKVFCAFGMSEIQDNFISTIKDKEKNYYILIDIANGHMEEEWLLGKELKKLYPKTSLMGGNIADPYTYSYYDEAGFDYLRVGIGSGAGCLTSTNTAIGCPMASLLSDTKRVKNHLEFNGSGHCEIIADGGIYSYSDVIKCLALGADYVMMGRTLAKSFEAAGKIKYTSHTVFLDESITDLEILLRSYKEGLISNLTRDYYGMSTKKAQEEINEAAGGTVCGKLKTSEGKSLELPVEYTLSGWVENMADYLKSAMSYTDSRNLKEFYNHARVQVISGISSSGINKK